MILLIDAGNTRIKWALTEADGGLSKWITSGSIGQSDVAQLEDGWRRLTVTEAIIANVAGQEIGEALKQVLARIGSEAPVPTTWLASQAQAGGVRNSYRHPAQLGSDRFASAIGAHALFPDTALLIATCGTATTLDSLTADGVFTGGMILPGLRLMASSLARNTAQLPEVLQQSERLSPFADNTEEAIIGGCIAAQVGAIERAFAVHASLHAGEPVQAIMSGGAAAAVEPHLAIPYVHVDNLVLIGLHVLAQQRSPF